MGEFWQWNSVMNDTKELIFHKGYKMSGPERHVRAARRQHMQLQVLLINHKPGSGSKGTHIHLYHTYESIINVQRSWLTERVNRLAEYCRLCPYKGTKPEAPVRKQ